MTLFVTLLLTSMTPVSTVVFAEPDERTELVPEGTYLKIVGRGVRETGSDRTLVLACVGDSSPGSNPAEIEPSCDVLRFVLSNGKSVQYVGSRFYAPQHDESDSHALSEDEKIKVSLQWLMREFRGYRRGEVNERSDRKWAARDYLGGAMGIAAFGTFGAAAAGFVPVGIAVVAVGVLYPSTFLTSGGIYSKLGITRSARGVNRATVDQDGWNWSVRPDRVKKKIFVQLETFVQGYSGRGHGSDVQILNKKDWKYRNPN